MTKSVAKPTAVDQLEKMIQIAKDNFSPERFAKIEKLFEHFAERMVSAPASGMAHYHNCYPGGYLDHVHNVIEGVIQVAVILKKRGAQIDFTKEEAIFTAMFHDLGKLGDLDLPYYVPQTSDWHRENRGELYKHNTDLTFMAVPDRSLHLLNHFGVAITPKEWKAILVHDGLYSKGNEPYFISYSYPPQAFHTNLHYVLHFADHMSTIGERDQWRLNS
jgi:hypothetical protein